MNASEKKKVKAFAVIVAIVLALVWLARNRAPIESRSDSVATDQSSDSGDAYYTSYNMPPLVLPSPGSSVRNIDMGDTIIGSTENIGPRLDALADKLCGCMNSNKCGASTGNAVTSANMFQVTQFIPTIPSYVSNYIASQTPAPSLSEWQVREMLWVQGELAESRTRYEQARNTYGIG